MNFKYFIKDNQESSSIKEAIALLESKVGMSHEKADGYVRNDIRAAFPVLRTKHGGKFILGVTRLFVEQQLNDADAQNKLTRCLEEIDTDVHYNEYDRNLNGLSLDKLYTTFKDVISAKDKESRKKSEGKQYDSSNYQIYGPYTSFEQARKDWGNESQHWCVFHDENQYGYYTSAGQQFYVAAQNGWEDIPREVGKNAPKDAYGNSLIAVSVDLNGNLATATPRWNHDNDDDNVDHTYTVDELESIIQKPFYKTFLPKKSETVATFGENNIVKVLKADDKIKYYIGSEGCSEGNFSTLFDLKGNTLVPKFQDPLKVRINDKYNFLDTSGKILFDQWFDVAWPFSEGFASVKLNNKYNYIDIKGHLLSKQWFDFAMDFSEGVAPVALNNKYNFIDTKGNLLSNQWFDWAGMFKEGFVLVKLNNKSNFIDTKGHLLSNQWFDFATSFKEGFARVELDGEWNFIDTKGRLLSEQWFYEVRDFKEGFARVELSGKYNFLDTKGNYLSNQWFDSVRDFKEGFARVELGGGWNFIDTKGKILSEQWFYEAMSFVGGVAQVLLDGDWKHINTKGEIIDSWKSAMGLLKKIKDNQESSSIKEAIALLESKVGMSHEKADGYVRNDIRAAFPVLRTKHGGKFILGVTRLFVEQQLNDADTQNKLTRCLEEIDTDEHYNEYDRNLNGLSLDKLYATFKDVISAKDEESRKKSEGKQYGKSNYQIWGPYTSFEQARNDWGNQSQDWCVFHLKGMYNNYTSAGQQFYVAAQNGWEDIPREVGEGAPKDAYGNSLIAVSVDLNGNLATSTPRWNHDNGGGDNTYTVDELESIIQKPFYKTFLPKKSETVATFGENDIVKVLKADDKIKYYIGSKDYYKVDFSTLFDLKGNTLVPKFQDPLKVRINDKYNFIDIKGHILSNQWFDDVGAFKEGFARVVLNGEWNFIDIKGNIISKQWFDSVDAFKEGFALVKLHKKWNYIDTKGHLLSNRWFDFIGSFSEGFARVDLDEKMNFIDTKGNFVSKQWFDNTWDFEEGVAQVDLDEKVNLIDTKGNLVSKQWFGGIGHFRDGFARVRLGHEFNFIDTKGNILSPNQWFNDVDDFNGGIAQVKLNGQIKHINTKGQIVDSWKSAMGLLKKIKDNQESSSIKEAIALLESKAGMSHEKADGYVRNDIRAAFPVLRTKHGGKFILGVTRLFVEQQLNDADAQNKLTRCLEEIDTDEHYNEYDRNLNNLSLDKIWNTFKDIIAQKDEESRKKSEGKQYGKSNYQIWGPYTSFEQARKDWGNESQHWCVFHDENQYGYYTSAGQQFYVAAQNGWEDIPREVGEGAPKDAYGNSLIAISVDLGGNLATATPRWNHDNDDDNVDHTYTVDELESIIQKPFYKTFLPKKSEVIATFGENNIVKVLKVGDEVKYLIGSKGYSKGNFSRYFDLKGNALVPKFQDPLVVELSGKYNFLDIKGRLLSNQWFDGVGDFVEGFARVRLGVKWNSLGTEGNLLSKQWFDRVYDFYKGLTIVALNDKYNLIDTKGNILSPNQWFDYAGYFREDFAPVALNDKWNFIDTSGKLISNQWFDAANDFKEGFAPVNLNNKCNFIDTKGHLLSNQWFDYVDAFKEGFARVELNGEWNFIDIKGNIISKQWFDSVDTFKEGFALVGLNDKYNLVDTKGNIISNQWFDDVNDFNGGIAQVKLNGKWNFLDIKGRLLSNQWFNGVGVFKEGFAWVRLGHEYNFIDTKGNIISKQWFDSVDDFSEGIALVGLNDKYNLVDTKGNILSNQWFDDVNDFNGGIASVTLNGQIKHINTKGEIIDSWKSAMGLLKKIKDNQESSSIKEATALLESKAGMSHEKADGYVRNDIRAAFPVLRTKHGGKFILGVTRLFVEQQLNDADTQNKLTRCLEEIDTDAHYNEYDRNLNNLSLDKIWNTFKDIIAKKDEESRKKSEGKQYGKSNYQIWGPYTSFEQANDDWGNQSQDWCVFHDEDMYGYYTSAGQQFYVAAQNGWEDIPREVGKNAPKDAYGNSLIAISVDLNGNLATSTPRWNHAIDDNADHTYTVDELESIIQKPFYKTFLPKKSETIATFGENNIVKALKVDGVVKYLIGSEGCSEGNFSTLFDLKGNTLVPKFQDPLKVRINDKFNFIDTKGHILYDQWFDYACDFKEGFASVELNNKYNFIDIKGHLLSNQWVDVAWPFSEGFARVILNDKYNFIDTKEHILSDQWFDAANDFKEGFASVKLNSKYNFIDIKGHLLSNQWFDYTRDFKEGFALVTLNGHYKRINTKGQIVDSWKSAMGLLKKIK